MILVIRISGNVKIRKTAEETLSRMRLHKKYSATILQESEETMKLLQQIRNFVAYGKVDAKTVEEIVSKRGKPLDNSKKVDAKTVAAQIEKDGIKKSGIKPFFALHPPRGGIDSKIHYPKGVLGDNGNDIVNLVRRML